MVQTHSYLSRTGDRSSIFTAILVPRIPAISMGLQQNRNSQEPGEKHATVRYPTGITLYYTNKLILPKQKLGRGGEGKQVLFIHLYLRGAIQNISL